jgi:hypothetical protein
MRFFTAMFLSVVFSLTLCAQSQFALTPEMFASLMAKSLEGNLPQSFKYKELTLLVTKVSVLGKQVVFDATTTQSKEILNELYKHHTLPDDLKKQCRDFSKISMVDKGVEYLLVVNASQKDKGFEVLFDRDACDASFDPMQKIFVGGYNRYGLDRFGRTKKENAKRHS